MTAQKKWMIQELSEIERLLLAPEEISNLKSFIERFEKIDEDFRDQDYGQLYLKMWKIAFNAGKLDFAKTYAKKSIQYLITLKRIPKILELLAELNTFGILKNQSYEVKRKCELLLGKKIDFHSEDLKNFELMEDHPEHWKEFPDFLKQYLLIVSEWQIEEWKLCYEYLLLHHFDKDLTYTLMEKAHENGKNDLVKKFEQLFSSKNIRIKKLRVQSRLEEKVTSEKLLVDYDQVAMELLSGEKIPDDQEQMRVLRSLKHIPREELMQRGHDMIVAFELLGMEKVVVELCDEVIKTTEDVKQRSSLYFIWAQALFNLGEYFKVIDLIEEVLAGEPFYEEERIPFLYLKAEACLKLKKIKMAKDLFSQIKKYNPHYRLVQERLRTIETLK